MLIFPSDETQTDTIKTNILDFQISRSRVATQLRWGGSLYNRSVESFLQNLRVKELWKSVFICRSYKQKTKWLSFGTRCICLCSSGTGTCGCGAGLFGVTANVLFLMCHELITSAPLASTWTSISIINTSEPERSIVYHASSCVMLTGRHIHCTGFILYSLRYVSCLKNMFIYDFLNNSVKIKWF